MTSASIAKIVNDSLTSCNLHGLALDSTWTYLISDYFNDNTKADDSDSDSNEEGSGLLYNVDIITSGQELRDDCDTEENDVEDEPVTKINEVSLVIDACSNLVCDDADHIKRQKKKRQLTRISYYHEGQQICRDTFKMLHCISQNKLTAIISWYKEHGFACRSAQSGGRVEKRAFSLEDVTRVVSFITNYTESNAIVLPGRIPGYARSDIKFLPSYESKASLWRVYSRIMEEEDARVVKLSSFRRLWQELLPFIVVMKPMTDLCWRCQSNNNRIFKSANLPLSEKSAGPGRTSASCQIGAVTLPGTGGTLQGNGAAT